MSDSNKRKQGPGEERSKGFKKSKGGSGGKWQTTHQAAKLATRGSGHIEAGDVGIWATCARRMEGRATEELKVMFKECADRFYGLKSDPEEDDEDELADDIEASIKKEVASMGDKKGTAKLFSPVHLDIECVMFFKTRLPIDPVDFVHRICKEAATDPDIRRMRYVNRLTPVTVIGKASERGLTEVGESVLGPHFELSSQDGRREEDEEKTEAPYSYAIRPTIRNHNTLKRDAVIKQVAKMVGNAHKVDLTAPDKVIIVEIYQTVCGMSVVGGDWEELKRFNLSELYHLSKPPPIGKAETSPEKVTKDEAPVNALLPSSTDNLVT